MITALRLTRPVNVAGKTTDRLMARPLSEMDFSWACQQAGSAHDMARALMARVCGVAPDVIRALHPADLARLAAVVDRQLNAEAA